MKKTFKCCSLILLAIVYSLGFTPCYPKAISDVILIEDSPNISEFPHHFRTTADKITIDKNQPLNLEGLDKLNISGSGQFSENELSLVRKAIPSNFSVTDIDLREESHGFINGIAVSWKNENNSANKGLTKDEVLADENKRLESMPLNKPITLSNTNKEIIPKEVFSEMTLAKNNGLSYIRIPVTDGHLPTNDMVDYFIDIVNNQPTNSWFHFHCKEGIGRTTTFMIMYDIIKNHDKVSLNDIIKRQVILSKMNEKDAQTFYTGEHFKFLNDFYNKYKNATSSTHSQGFKNNICASNDFYIKNSTIPKYLYVISEEDMSLQEQTMISTLQGIISNKSEKQIYILTSKEPDYEVWLQDLNSNYNVKYKTVKNPWILLNKFKSYINGYILYSNSNPPSINNACSLASLKDSIAIDETLESKVKSYGINSLIEDCRNTDKYWAYDNLWNLGLNHSTVIELLPGKSMALRDYAIMSKSLIFYEDDIHDTSLMEKIFKSMDNTARCLGWGPDEYINVSVSSKYGVDMIAADWSYNLSVLSSYPTSVQTQNCNKEIPKEDDVHYVTFIMSDGDNQQWLLGNNYSSKDWYGSPYRGNFNLGWSISPSLYYLAPTIFKEYYKSASSQNYCDNFLVPPSGNGYIYPSKFPIDKLESYTNRLNEYMKRVDQNYVVILDDDAFYNINLWDKYTHHSNINGLFYLNYKKNNDYECQIIWSNNKPIVSCADLLWNGLEDEEELINNINSRVELGYTDIKNPNSYTFVYVHVWSKNMDNVEFVINKLNDNPKIKVVTPDIFMKLIKENISGI